MDRSFTHLLMFSKIKKHNKLDFKNYVLVPLLSVIFFKFQTATKTYGLLQVVKDTPDAFLKTLRV